MEKIKCSHCLTENLSNAKYCSHCGFELLKGEAEIQSKTNSPKLSINKKISLKGKIGIVVGVTTMLGIQQFLFKTPSYDKAMMEVASELNKTCPLMVDAETRLDNTIAIPDNVFQYNYTLINRDKGSIDTTELKKIIEPTLANFVRTSPQLKVQRDHLTTLNYCYKDKNGQYILTISVTPEKYKQ